MQLLLRNINIFKILIVFSLYLNRNAFVTELFTDDITTNLANNSLLAVDLTDLTIRTDISDKTFEQLLSKFIK
jgi:hypothetical protein